MVTTYLQGLMLPIECKAIEPMALALDGGDVQAMQQCIGQGQWQDDMLLRRHWRLVDETLGEADGVYIVAGSDVPKHGAYSVGVARQWCGHLGKVDNCQAGVFAAYASRYGYTLLDRRLYLPEEIVRCGTPRAVVQVWHPRRDTFQDEAGPGPRNGAGHRDGGRPAVSLADVR